MALTGQPHELTAIPLGGPKSPKPIEFEAGWDPEPVWTFWKRDKSRYPAGIRTANRPSHNLVTIPTAASQDEGSSRRMERIVQRGAS